MVTQSDYVQYRCGLQAEPVNLDPAKTDDFAMVFIGNNLYETLVTLSDSGLTPQPLLATNWTIAENGTRYDFMLREQVSFHDGAPFNAEAVKISFERQIFPTSEYYSETPANIYAEEMLSMIESVDVIDSLHHPVTVPVLSAPMHCVCTVRIWVSTRLELVPSGCRSGIKGGS